MTSGILRKLARSSKYQMIFTGMKELNGIKMFRNEIDFTGIQLLFLRWASVYHSLYTDLAMEKSYISEAVIQDDIRTEAYLLYRREHKDDRQTPKPSSGSQVTGLPKVIFTKRPKGKQNGK